MPHDHLIKYEIANIPSNQNQASYKLVSLLQKMPFHFGFVIFFKVAVAMKMESPKSFFDESI